MTKRQLGTTNLHISPLVFGGNVFGWTIDKTQSFKLLDQFTEAGFETIDTADMYSVWAPGNKGGESETIIGEWLHERKNRHNTTIITKVGNEISPEKKGLSANYIIQAAEDSLRRLKTDYIDVYLSHICDPTVPYEETLNAYQKLIDAGKVRYIGASNHSAAQLKDALSVSNNKHLASYQVLQPEYNLFDRSSYEGDLETLAKQSHLGVITYYSLASGFLSGKYRSEADLNKSVRGGGIKKYLNKRGFRILKALDTISQKYQANPSEIALAWLIHSPGVTAPIASATSKEQLNSLIQSTRIHLNSDDMRLLNTASSPLIQTD